MALLTAIDDLRRFDGPVHLAIGVFDGVHRGHQAVIGSAVAAAKEKGGVAIVATFDPHPAEVLAPDKAPKRLTPLAHQVSLFEALGIQATLAIPFNQQLAGQTPEQFVDQLCAVCSLTSIHVGEDWVFGKGRTGNVTLLAQLGADRGFDVCGVASLLHDDARISSSQIRALLAEAKLGEVKDLLGRSFTLRGEIVHGDHLGRLLGFPTANLAIGTEALPPFGVYLVRALSHNNHPGIANLGIRPTVSGEKKLRFEVHFLDFDQDLYGKTVEVALLHHLRPERRFPDLNALKQQIAEDLEHAREWFGNAP